MDRSRYLDRLRLDLEELPENDFDRLVQLQQRHVHAIPFTNAFVRTGDGTTLDPEVAVPRLVAGGGGLCYDLNGAFAWLLGELGYDVALVSARPKHDDGSFGPEYDHLALLVDGHVVDVGFGDFARHPLPLEGDPRTDVSGTYRIDERDAGDEAYVVRSRTSDGWEPVYRFSSTPREASEFDELMAHHSTAPESPFTGKLLATLPTETGRITLSGDSLTITDGDDRRKRDVPSRQVSTVLRERLGLSYRTDEIAY